MGSFIDGYLHSFKRHIEGVQEAEAARLGSQLAEQQGIANGMALTIADSALKAAGDKLGLSPVEINLARAELYKGMGDFEGATELYAGALEELPPFDRATVESSMSDGIEKLLEEILSTIRQRTTEQTGIYELIVIDDKLRTMIHNGDSETEVEGYARTRGPGIREDGCRKVIAGETTLEEILRVTREG